MASLAGLENENDNDSVMNGIDDNDHEPTSSGRKRRKPSVASQRSLSFVKPSQSAKQKLLTRDSFQYWLCEEDERDISIQVLPSLYKRPAAELGTPGTSTSHLVKVTAIQIDRNNTITTALLIKVL